MESLFKTMKVFVLLAGVAAVTYGQSTELCSPELEQFCAEKEGSPKSTACLSEKKSEFNTGDHTDDPYFKDDMLLWHNFYRSRPWNGPGGPIEGADIVAVKWDRELELNALMWANQQAEQNGEREDGKSLSHDDCRETPSYNYVGQNIAWAAGGSWKKPIDVNEKAVAGWNAENASIPDVKMLTESFPGAYLNQTIAIGHYTQLMWAKTSRIGCAYVTANSATYTTQGWIVCNYAQGGNIRETPVFTPGDLGTKCIKGSEGGSGGLCQVSEPDTEFREQIGLEKSTPKKSSSS